MNLRRHVTTLILKLLRPFGPGRKPAMPDFKPDRIAVMRFGGFGDVLAITSLTRALREDYPDAEIHFFTDAASTVVLENNPDIDRVIVSPKLRLGLNPVVIAENIARVRRWTRTPYDLAIIPHHEFGILLLALFFRARFRVGYDINERGFDFAFTHSSCTYTSAHPRITEHMARHFTAHQQELLHAFQGRTRKIVGARVEISDAERAWAETFLTEHGLGGDLVIVAPGGSTPTKLWPIPRFAEIARRLIEEHDVAVLVMVGPAEASHEEYFPDMPGRFLFDAGGNTFRQNMVLTKFARAMVGNDTGLMHVAAQFDVPAVALFGPTPPTVFGYAHRGHRIVIADLPCIPCNAPFCSLLPDGGVSETAPCMDAILPDRVMGEMTRLLSEATGGSSTA